MMKVNNAHRAAVVRAWRDARTHGEDQVSFCARQVPPIRPRTLRQWSKSFGASAEASGPGSDIRLIYAALANLQLLADLLERARLDNAPPCRDAGLAGEPRHATVAEADQSISAEAPAGTPAAPKPEGAPSQGMSFWDES